MVPGRALVVSLVAKLGRALVVSRVGTLLSLVVGSVFQ